MPKVSESPITQEEIRFLIRQGTEAGAIEQDELDIVERVLRLGARRASTIMTPRRELVFLSTSDAEEDVRRKISDSGFSMFPVCGDSLDDVVGVVRLEDVLRQLIQTGHISLRSIVRQPLFLPESVSSLRVFDELKGAAASVALLHDEHGGLQGVITSSDLLRAILGEMSYAGVPKAARQPDGSWLIDGMLRLDELYEALGLRHGLDKRELAVETAGGLMQVLFNRIPEAGDSVSFGSYMFRILDMDGLRVDKILAQHLDR